MKKIKKRKKNTCLIQNIFDKFFLPESSTFNSKIRLHLQFSHLKGSAGEYQEGI